MRITLDCACNLFDYDFVANVNNVIAPERIVERIIEKPVEVIKEVQAEKPQGFFNKLIYLVSDK